MANLMPKKYSERKARARAKEAGVKSPREVRRHSPPKSGTGNGVCMSPHPSLIFVVNEQNWPVLCERPAGHKVQHRAKIGGGYKWWS